MPRAGQRFGQRKVMACGDAQRGKPQQHAFARSGTRAISWQAMPVSAGLQEARQTARSWRQVPRRNDPAPGYRFCRDDNRQATPRARSPMPLCRLPADDRPRHRLAAIADASVQPVPCASTCRRGWTYFVRAIAVLEDVGDLIAIGKMAAFQQHCARHPSHAGRAPLRAWQHGCSMRRPSSSSASGRFGVSIVQTGSRDRRASPAVRRPAVVWRRWWRPSPGPARWPARAG